MTVINVNATYSNTQLNVQVKNHNFYFMFVIYNVFKVGWEIDILLIIVLF